MAIDSSLILRDAHGDVRVLFLGRGPADREPAARLRTLGVDLPVVWNRQVHSARVVEAHPGTREQADGLFTASAALALAVVTADCVPVLLSAGGAVAALHAGWRGLAAGILERGVAALRERDSGELRAWIGPAIGPCCYEVGWDVAQQIARRAGGEVILPPPKEGGERPHLDLASAARLELVRCGVEEVRCFRRCTFCGDDERWSSYRREGAGSGRNLAVIWRDVLH